MRSTSAIAIALLLAGCDYRQPGMSSADIQEFAASHPGITQTCSDDVRWGRRFWWDATPEKGCFEMQRATRWRGLWDSGWEWSIFCTDPTHKCETSPEKGDAWLEFSEGAYNGPRLTHGLYEIEFIGRRTAQPAGFGHLGQYDYEIIVDRVISMKKVSEDEG